jgi:hypothetical protein
VAIVSVFARACVDEHPKRRVRGIRLIDRLTMFMMGPILDATLGTPRFVVLVMISILLGGAIYVAVYTGV